MNNITDTFIERLDEVYNSDLSDSTIHQIKRCILDYVGVTFAGEKFLGHKLDFAIKNGTPGECLIIGKDIRKDIMTAVMANGFAAHVLELDDGHRFGTAHLEASVITSMIAIAQKEKLKYEQFLKGILMGYEATIRLSSAIQPSHKIKGFHSSGTCGTVGVAAAIAYSLGFTHTEKKTAISAGALSAAGLLNAFDDNSELKPLSIINAAQRGIMAAYLGKCGLLCPTDSIGGERGFLNTFSSDCSTDKLVGETRFPMIHQIYVKPYAACRHAHAAIDCILHIMSDNDIDYRDIEKVEIGTYRLAIKGHDQKEPTSISGAKMSIPFSAAIAIVKQSCLVNDYEEKTIKDEAIRTISKKIVLLENEKKDKEYPDKRGAVVTIALKSGLSFSYEVDYALGEPERPLSDKQLKEKYTSLMRYAGVQNDIINQVQNDIMHLEDQYSYCFRFI